MLCLLGVRRKEEGESEREGGEKKRQGRREREGERLRERERERETWQRKSYGYTETADQNCETRARAEM